MNDNRTLIAGDTAAPADLWRTHGGFHRKDKGHLKADFVPTVTLIQSFLSWSLMCNESVEALTSSCHDLPAGTPHFQVGQSLWSLSAAFEGERLALLKDYRIRRGLCRARLLNGPPGL